jgi:enediyne biosynthesis protein E4
MKNLTIVSIVILLSCSCKKEVKNNTLFTILPSSLTNIDFKNQLNENEEFNIIEYLYFNNGAGIAAGDINNDNLIDLFFVSNQQSDKLYLNKGNFNFEDITESSGMSGNGNWKTGVTMADVNGDGLLDIYLCQVGNYKSFNGRNQLFINQGNLKFKEEASEYGIDFQGFSTQAAFFDFDVDGDLDMFLLNHSVHTSRSYGGIELRYDNDEMAGDRLYRNDKKNGHVYFTDVTVEAGILRSQIGYGLGVGISDINNDGFPDIYISNDFHENDYLYINNGGKIFTERLTEFIEHTSRSSMGNDIGDFNNDGLMDIIVLDMLPDNEKIRKQSGGEDDYELFQIKENFGYNYQYVRNTLQLNLGDSIFSEIGALAGIHSTDWSWSPLFCDLDNDGWKDLFITNGIYRRANDLDYVKFLTGGNRNFPLKDNSNIPNNVLYEKMPLHKDINFLFRNRSDLTFSDESQNWGAGPPSYSNGSAYADLDNDGDMDLIVNNINDAAFIYRNNSEKLSANHYLKVKFKGEELNQRGTGARVTVYSNGLTQVAEQFSTRGFMSSVPDVLHFGLGSCNVIDSIIVRWPDLSEERKTSIKSDTTITFNYIDASSGPLKDKEKNISARLFSNTAIPGLVFRHKEDPYMDFYREKLIPHSLSAEGPALASGDFNGDGLQDIFLGSSRFQQSRIFIQQESGFKTLPVPLLAIEMENEDVDAAIFDADGDGDNDLFIGRGANELTAGNFLLTDLLLINDGKGGFRKGILPFISHNGSCVRPCDYDRDGDTDLFLGSRSIPGAYGLSPDQYLLENNGHGEFRDVTDIIIRDIRKAGMVTDAVWFDYDNDGDQDLAVSGEWMKICIFENESGSFKDVTEKAGFDKSSGWWYCLKAADIDKDGDTDLIGGNLGNNSLLKASPEQPVEMYMNDFDNNGSVDQIICSYHEGLSYPVSSFDEIASQIMGLGKAFPSYSDYAGKTISDLFSKDMIDKSIVKRAETFESSLFLNNGDGTFVSKHLPVEAQFSTVRDILVKDFNSDGINDMVLVGNNYHVRPSYGRFDASYGWFLAGETDNVFKVFRPGQSGFKIKGDSRKIGLIEFNGKQYLLIAVNDGDLHIFRTSE